jgi:hypothetical protein
MTQTIDFVESTLNAPQFQVTLDAQPAVVVVTWNVSAQRYYVNIYNRDGVLIVARALVESPPGTALAALTWDQSRLVATATLAQPWRRQVGQVVDYAVRGCNPVGYNGVQRSLVLNDTQFEFELPTNPGPISLLGWVYRDFDMLQGWAVQSTMTFRDRRFTVIP